MCGQYFKISIFIGSWSLLQILIHMSWILFVYHLYNCEIQVHSLEMVLLYLTYFYDQKCGPINLTSNATINSVQIFGYFNSNNDTISYETALKDILDRAELPTKTASSDRVLNYLYASLVMDTLWAVASITLITGAALKFQRTKSVLTYGPWLFVTAVNVFFDVVSSVHFGLDLLKIKNFSTWLKFIGVTNYKTFTIYDDLPYTTLITSYPTSLLCLLFARFFIVWLSNILCFFCMMHMLAMLYQGQTCDRHNHAYYTRDSAHFRDNNFGGMDPTASARIRTWQMFYGTVDSVTSSTSSNEDNPDNTIHSSASKANASMSSPNQQTLQYQQPSKIPNQQSNEFCELRLKHPTNDVRLEKSSVELVIRNQLPWSYFANNVDLELTKRKLSVDRNNELPQKYVDEHGDIRVKPSGEAYTKL